MSGRLPKPEPLNVTLITPKREPALFAAPDGPLQHGKRCAIEMTCEIFETDVPSQHAWAPENGRKRGKYKVLWQTTLRQTIEEKDQLPETIQKALDRAPKPQPTPPPIPSR